MLVEEQDEVIDMLERLRDHKQYVIYLPLTRLKVSLDAITCRRQLNQFSTRILASSSGHFSEETKMEIDSMASTPLAK